MKKLLALYGSPRRDGNSTTLMKRFVDGARETGLFEIEEVVIRDLKLSPCLEIYKCRTDGVCAINDDFQKVAAAIETADVIALSSPVMFYAVSAHTKMLMDRGQSFWARKYFAGRAMPAKAGYFFCTGATKGSKLFDGILMCVKYFFDAIDTKLVDSILVRGVDEKGDILKLPEVLESAYRLGKSLT